MKTICKVAGAVIIIFLMSIAPYLSEKLVPEAQAMRGRGAAFAAGAAVGSAASAPAAAGPGVDPGRNQPGAAGNVGRDPGINQPGAAGNIKR